MTYVPPSPWRCDQTGALFPSMTAAMRATGIAPSGSSTRRIAKGLPVKGLTFTRLTPDDPDWDRAPRFRREGHPGTSVRLVETGQIFPSIAAALRHLGMEPRGHHYDELQRLLGRSWHLEPVDPDPKLRDRIEKRRRHLAASALWTPPELAALEILANQHPTRIAVHIYNRQAAQCGWRKRTLGAVRVKLREIAGTTVPIIDGWTSAELSRQLGLNEARVRNWINRGHLPRRQAGRNLAIYREDMKELARRSPHLLGGIEPEALLWLLEDPEWVRRLQREHPRPAPQVEAHQVIRPLDGRIWPSARVLARELGVSYSAVWQAVKRGIRCKGHRYVWLHEFRSNPERFREVS